MSENVEQPKRCWPKCLDLCRTISTGKHNTGIYYKHKTQYSSVFGGVVTVCYGLFLVGMVASIMDKVYNMTETTPILKYETFSFDKLDVYYTLYDLFNDIDISFSVSRTTDNNYLDLFCDEVILSGTYKAVTYGKDSKNNTDA